MDTGEKKRLRTGTVGILLAINLGTLALVFLLLGIDEYFDLRYTILGTPPHLHALIQGAVILATVIFSTIAIALLRREHLKAAAANQLKDELIRLTSEMAKVGGWELDIATGRITWTDEVARIHDLDPAQVTKGPSSEGFHTGEVHQQVRRTLQEAAAADKPCDLEVGVTTIRGNHKWVRIVGQPIMEGGRVTCVRGIVQDITARKRMEHVLFQNEAQYYDLFQNAPIGYIQVSAGGTIRRVNQALLTMLGYQAEELIGQSIIALHPAQADAGQRMAELRRLFLAPDGGPYEMEDRMRRADGKEIWVSISLTPMRNADGIAVGARAAIQDITARREAEEALRVSKNQFQALVETTSDFIWEIDTNGVYTYCSPQIKALWGFEPQATLDKSPFDNMRPEAREQVVRAFREMSASPRPIKGLEVPSLDASGQDIMLEISCVPFFDADGRLCGYRGISRDVTERKRGEQLLRQERDFAKNLLDIAGVIILALDRTGRVTLVNAKACEILGCRAEEIIGKDWLDSFLPPRQRAGIRALHAQIVSGATDSVKYAENEVLTAQGEERTIAWHNTVIRDEQGRITGTLSSGEDITERKQAEEALRASERKYRSLVESVPSSVSILQQGRIVFANRQTEQLTGYTLAELQALDPFNIIHPDDREMVRRYYARRLQGEEVPASYTARLLGKDGTLHWCSRHALLITWEGQPAVLLLDADITRLKQAEEVLRENEERYRRIFEGLNDAVLFADPKSGLIVEANRHAEKLLERPRTEIIGLRQDALHPPETAALYQRRFAEFAAQGKVPEAGGEVLRKDGQRVPVTISSSLVNIGGRELLMGVFHNITQLKQAEEALRERERRLREAQSIGHVGSWEYDLATQTMVWSDEMYVLHELDRNKEPPGFDQLSCYYAPEEVARLRELAEEAIRTGQECGYDTTATLPSGRTVFFRGSLCPWKDEQGRLVRLLATVHDVTDMKRAEQELAASYRKLERTLEGTIEAIARISEIRDPYTAGHQKQVASIAEAIAVRMALPADLRRGLRVASLVHDIGKIHIPSEILTKPGGLSDLEFQIIKTHAACSAEILSTVDFPWPIAEIVMQHHERWDGSGYPRGLKGEEIMLEARIMAVADVVEAMASHRPYRPSLGVEKAMEEIATHSGSLFDAHVVQACRAVFASGFEVVKV